MVAVWNQKVNPWGPTGGNPMVKVTFQGRPMWSYYRYPSTNPVSGNGTVPSVKYQRAWDVMYNYYVVDSYNQTSVNNVFSTATKPGNFAPPGGKFGTP